MKRFFLLLVVFFSLNALYSNPILDCYLSVYKTCSYSEGKYTSADIDSKVALIEDQKEWKGYLFTDKEAYSFDLNAYKSRGYVQVTVKVIAANKPYYVFYNRTFLPASDPGAENIFMKLVDKDTNAREIIARRDDTLFDKIILPKITEMLDKNNNYPVTRGISMKEKNDIVKACGYLKPINNLVSKL